MEVSLDGMSFQVCVAAGTVDLSAALLKGHIKVAVGNDSGCQMAWKSELTSTWSYLSACTPR